MKQVPLNNRIHIVDDELGEHIEELRRSKIDLEMKIKNARKVVEYVSDQINGLTKSIEGALLDGHLKE